MQKIMIIEDEPSVREELAILLNNEGYQALVINDFVNIPEQAADSGPDLILLDLGLMTILPSPTTSLFCLPISKPFCGAAADSRNPMC